MDSCRNFLTLYIVIKAVGDEDIMMIGQVGPENGIGRLRKDLVISGITYVSSARAFLSPYSATHLMMVQGQLFQHSPSTS